MQLKLLSSLFIFLVALQVHCAEPDVNPYIEVEKYDSAESKTFKAENQDKIKFLVKFQFNNLQAKNLTNFSTFNLSTSSEAEIGAEYVKHLTDTLNLFARATLNRYVMPEITTLTPPLGASNKTQASLTLGGQYLFTDDNYLDYFIGYRPRYYLVINSAGSIELDYAQSSSVGLETENHFYNFNDLIVGVVLGTEYVSNVKISGNSFAYNVGLIYQQDFKSHDNLNIKINYSQISMDSEYYKLTDNVISVNFIYSLPY